MTATGQFLLALDSLALGATAIAGAASAKPLDKVAPIVPATAAATAAAVGAPGARDTTP